MSRPNYWPAGPNYYQAPNVRPPLELRPEPLFPYSDWGQIHATTIWQDAGRCEAGADPYFAGLLEEGGVPTEALPYVRAGDWPPEPGSRAYQADIRPQFVDRLDEQHYIDWWYAHFTSDAAPYTIPEPPLRRPPRDWPAQAPPTTPAPPEAPSPPPLEPEEPSHTPTAQPPTAERPVPWGWVVGGSAVALLIGGGIAYAVTRPKKRRKRG